MKGKIWINLLTLIYFIWIIYAVLSNKRKILDRILDSFRLDGANIAIPLMILTLIVSIIMYFKLKNKKDKERLKRSVFFGIISFLIAFLSHVDLFVMPFFLTIFIHNNLFNY